MKTIIAGSRSIDNMLVLHDAIVQCKWVITGILCGQAKGVDTLGKIWGLANNIPVCYYPADWDKYGKAAGHIRNAEMAKDADALLAIWDGVSKGTANMITQARRLKLKVHVVNA